MSSFEELGEVLLKNPRENWATILAEYFKVDLSLVETLVDAYNEMTPERFKEVMEQANDAKEKFYNEYYNGQILTPTDEQIKYAYEMEAKITKELEEKKKEFEEAQKNITDNNITVENA